MPLVEMEMKEKTWIALLGVSIMIELFSMLHLIHQGGENVEQPLGTV